MPEVRFRPARKQDCADIARLYSISSDGVADYVWSTLAEPGESPVDVGRRRYEREDTLFSYENCTIADIDDVIAGMLVAFPVHIDREAPAVGDPVLAPYSRLEEDNSYYICGVALFEPYRGLGVGTRLMRLAEQKARALDLDKLSLIVFEQNVGAKRLYERLGFIEKAREKVVPHPLIHHAGDAVLMVKRFD